jgi:hypothetical protein
MSFVGAESPLVIGLGERGFQPNLPIESLLAVLSDCEAKVTKSPCFWGLKEASLDLLKTCPLRLRTKVPRAVPKMRSPGIHGNKQHSFQCLLSKVYSTRRASDETLTRKQKRRRE